MLPTTGACSSETTNGGSAVHCTSGIFNDPRNAISEAEAGALICHDAYHCGLRYIPTRYSTLPQS